MDQLAANKWLPKIEQDIIRSGSELRFNPFPAELFPDFPSPFIENQSQIPLAIPNHDVLNSYPSSSSSSSQRTASDHRKVVVPDTASFPSFNTISFAGAGAGNNNNSKSTANSNGYVKMSGAVDGVFPVQINFSSSAPVTTAPTTFEEFYGAVEYDEVPAMKSGGVGRTSLQSQEHILAERKRREKLSKNFVALSAIVPGLKKLDKASVLDGAIKYLKQLEERIKNMEENSTTSSTTVCKRTRQSFSGGGDTTLSSSDVDNNVIMCSNHRQDLNQPSSSSLPEIDVKISGENVLLRIFCLKIDGIFKEILFHVENLNLSIINSSASPFGKFNLYIAIVAQTDHDFCMSCEGLAKYIREVVQDFV